jgi:hypothetical protein
MADLALPLPPPGVRAEERIRDAAGGALLLDENLIAADDMLSGHAFAAFLAQAIVY